MRMGFWMATTLAIAVAITSGCGHSGSAPAQVENRKDAHDEQAAPEANGHDHSGYWCNEHGVPEAICGQCNSKVAAEFQRKGDWCKEHDRPDSQCFTCHAELEAKFAAQYEAKYGKKPPKPQG